MKLMILDDDVQIREGIQFGIDWKSLGISEVKSFGDAVSALEELEEFSPQIILADIRMPEMDGLTATKEIRKFNATIPIIALSANAVEADKLAALEAGCNDYLVKPVDKVKLMSVLEKYR